MIDPNENKLAVAFRWVVIAGILQDWFFALPGIFIPAAIIQFAGADPVVPPYWPDTPEVRSDILDYYFAVERFDHPQYFLQLLDRLLDPLVLDIQESQVVATSDLRELPLSDRLELPLLQSIDLVRALLHEFSPFY